MARCSVHKLACKVLYLILRCLGGTGFANPAFSPWLLFKHLFIQRILGIGRHVPWPVHPTSKITCVDRIDRGTRCPGLSLGCYIQGENGIIFGKNVWVGPGVGIISANHSVDDFERHRKEKPIRIGDNCWIGMNAVILPGVELGEHVIVGAGSIVTRSFGPNCMIVGNPARVIKEISPYRNSTIEAKPERHSKE